MGFVMGIFFSSLGGPSSMGMPDIDVPHLHALSLVRPALLLCLHGTTGQGRVEEADGGTLQAHGTKRCVDDEGRCLSPCGVINHLQLIADVMIKTCGFSLQAFAYVGALYATTECVVEKVRPRAISITTRQTNGSLLTLWGCRNVCSTAGRAI